MTYNVFSGTLNPTHSLSVRTSHTWVCICHCTLLLYAVHHRTVLTVFPLILQTFIAQMLATGAKGDQLSVRFIRSETSCTLYM